MQVHENILHIKTYPLIHFSEKMIVSYLIIDVPFFQKMPEFLILIKYTKPFTFYNIYFFQI